MPERTPQHGTDNEYVKWGCRCRACTDAHTGKVNAERRSDRPIPPQVHGSINGYNNYGCRCGRCTEASRAYRAPRRNKHKKK